MNKILVFLLLIFVALWSCESDSLYTSSDARLKFSMDTVRFDTVFTAEVSVTKRLMVYNTYDDDLEISEVRLAKGNQSSYRINVDGVNANTHNQVLLRGKDSLYIFIELNINENNNTESFEEVDSIVFRLNGNNQDVDLRAWGLNVDRIKTDIETDFTFESSKSYFIEKLIRIKEGVKCVFQEGTALYFGINGGIELYGEADMQGSIEKPVQLKGSRLEDYYFDVPGLWKGFFARPGSKIKLEGVEIFNAQTGLLLDSAQSLRPGTPIIIEDSKISHHSYASIVAKNTDLKIYNSELANAGNYLLRIDNGGEHELIHCTLANYWNISSYIRFHEALSMTNYTTNENRANRNLNFHAKNTIVYGNKNEEIEFDNKKDGEEVAGYSILFSNCLLRTSEKNSFLKLNESILNERPNFVDTKNQKYQLDEESPAVNKAGQFGLFPYDLLGENRYLDGKADIGAYEWFKKEEEE